MKTSPTFPRFGVWSSVRSDVVMCWCRCQFLLLYSATGNMCATLSYFTLAFIFVCTVFLSRAENGTDSYTTSSPFLILPLATTTATTTVADSYISDLTENIVDTDPFGAFKGLYSECITYLSYPCFQRKLVVFLDRLDKKKNINLYGNFIYFLHCNLVND